MKKLRSHTKQDVWRFVDVKNPDDCWEWQGYVAADGYGQFNVMGLNMPPHRVTYELSTNNPAGPVVMHLCNNRRCCNPKHLKAGTHSENSQYMWKSGRLQPSATGIVGVRFEKGRNRYIAAARTKGKRVVLYQGRDFFEACCARKSWEARL